MKHLLGLFLIGLFAMSVSGQDKWRKVDIRINGIGNGTSYSTVIKKLGKPLRIRDDEEEECSSGYLKTLFYDGLKIEFWSDEKKQNYTVTSIELVSQKWLIASDIRIGASMEDVRAKFGQPNSSEGSEGFDKDHLDYTTKKNFGWAHFYFRNNKLVKVEMAGEMRC